MTAVSLVFKCQRCGAVSTKRRETVDPLNIEPVGKFTEFPIAPVTANMVHNCTATQRGACWFVGYDILEAGRTGNEPSLGGGR